MEASPRQAGLGLLAAVAALATAAPAEATFPGRNGAIAFAHHSFSGGGPPEVEHRGLGLAAPGEDDRRDLLECELTDGAPSGGDCAVTTYSEPSYSPDGRRIVFDAGERLAVVDSDGTDLTLLPSATANDGSPAFAPDGKRIVFTGTNDRGTTDVYVRRLDGGEARVLVYDASEPAWSSRNVLAYVRVGNVYVRASGGRRRFVTSGVSPDWSPDGRRLVLIRPHPNLTFAGDTGRLYVVTARGRGLRRIGARDDLSHPVWSPDGRWLAYDGFDLGVYRKRLGSRRAPREVAPTQIGGEGALIASFEPAWRPRPTGG